MAEFITPVFLKNHSPEEVLDLMKRILPEDLDLSAGGHAYNLLMPTALVIAELCEFVLPEVVKVIFPEWAYGEYLDAHAKTRGMTRRAASAANGTLTITGAAGTAIQQGHLFSTASVNGEPSVDYRVLRSARIPESGVIDVEVECTQTGVVGNTSADTIILVSSRITGIKSVTNAEEMTGGTEMESDADLIERIVEYDMSQGDSFVGNVSDYTRWASSVPGVGGATIMPATDDTGLVTIVLTDSNGSPATTQLCDAVYNYIMRPDAPMERLAPVNALLSVVPPTTVEISIKATVELMDDATLESVQEAYMAKLADYLPVAMNDGEIKYSRVAAALASVDGANDYANIQIGVKVDGTVTYGTSNIAVASNQLPIINAEDLILTPGMVR